jgi:hypothetical protein
MFGILSAGLGIANGLFSLGAAGRAADRRRAAVMETARRLRLTHERTLSETTALGAASGVTMDSAGLQTYLTTMADEFRRQQQFALRAGIDEVNSMEEAAGWNAFGDIAGSMFSLAGGR